MKIKIPQKALDGIKFVRDSGETNMFDYHTVQRMAFENKYFATVDWMADNKDAYAKGIVSGFEAEEGDV